MVAAMGAPGAQDSQDAGSLPQQGWRLRGHAALGAKLRVRAQAEFLGTELNSKATVEGQFKHMRTNRKAVHYHSPGHPHCHLKQREHVLSPPSWLPSSGLFQSQWPAVDLPYLVDLLPSPDLGYPCYCP